MKSIKRSGPRFEFAPSSPVLLQDLIRPLVATPSFIFLFISSCWQTCGNDNNSNCAASPSPSQSAFMATWMEGVMNSTSNNNDSSSDQPVSASVPFLGTAVYVYCILSGSAASQNWTTDLTFVLDNTTVGTYLKQPSNNSSSDDFGQLVFSTTGLTNSTHILTIQSGLNSKKSLLLLDQIVYTQDYSDSSTGTSTKLPALVGGLVGGVAAFTILTGLAFLFYRRRQRQLFEIQNRTYLQRSNSDGYDFRDSTRVAPNDLYSPQVKSKSDVSVDDDIEAQKQRTERCKSTFSIPTITRPRLSFSPYSNTASSHLNATNNNTSNNNNNNNNTTSSFASNLLVTPNNNKNNRCSASVISEAPLSVSARLFRGVSVIEPKEIRDDPYVYIIKDDAESTIASETTYSHSEKF